MTEKYLVPIYRTKRTAEEVAEDPKLVFVREDQEKEVGVLRLQNLEEQTLPVVTTSSRTFVLPTRAMWETLDAWGPLRDPEQQHKAKVYMEEAEKALRPPGCIPLGNAWERVPGGLVWLDKHRSWLVVKSPSGAFYFWNPTNGFLGPSLSLGSPNILFHRLLERQQYIDRVF